MKTIEQLEAELLQAQREREMYKDIVRLYEQGNTLTDIVSKMGLDAFNKLQAETTQLRNAVDELVKALQIWHRMNVFDDTCIACKAIAEANNLPHRKERGV